MNIKNLLITGGADGLGRELALNYAKAGAKVVALDVDEEKGGKLSSENRNISFVPFDLSDFDEEEISALGGSFDLVICNAGISASGDFVEIPLETERDVFEVNALGHIKLIKTLLRRKMINRRARLVFVLSASVYLPFPIAVAYAASKSALDGFASALEPYLFSERVSVTRIYPGPMKTNHHAKYYPAFKEGRGVTSGKAARAIVKAVSRRKRKVFPDLPGKIFHFGSLVFPGMLRRLSYLYFRKLLKR